MTKLELLEKILAITKKQAQLLKNEEIDSFNVLLEQRQGMLEKLQQATSEINNKEQEEMLLEALKNQEEENKQELGRQLEEVKKKLKGIRQMRQGENHYNNPYDISWEEGVFFDKRGRR